ncbi:hypothetical protein [uncultured Chryseobacterium sp.]|uniref:hypothetical protein n=1 Tax=uncultured Chryseobacterium sp. TaxID=259322 RepID=UPI0025DA8DC9|nr:hypothetical protein [uncultured Chryseobacterium sp.]
MGYYRKGHFKKDGTWVSGHYVNAFGRGKRKVKSPHGCAVIILGGLVSLLIYFIR